MKFATTATCPECLRVFDLLDEDDAGEWHYGHDCEEQPYGYDLATTDMFGEPIIEGDPT